MATPAAAADGAEQKGLPFTIRHFDESLTFQVTLVSRARPGPVVRIAGHGLTRDLSLGDVTDIVVQVNDEKAIAFALRLEVASPDEVLVAQSTAVLVIAAGEWPASRWADLVPPHSRSIDYTANTAHDFHESPSIEWVTSAALRLLATGPDVLFIRYNQADHAQEFLYWEATRGGAANSALAYNQIATAYRQIAAGVATIIEAVGPECIVVVVSDHGIDYVDTRLAPNRILAEMELSEYFIFQGDSNVCYLYGERPLTSAEWRRFEEIIQSAGRGKLRVMSTAELRARDAFHRGRCGVMALESAAHAEFQYHDAPLVQRARSASHGFDPHQPSMNGIWQVIQGPDVPRPASVRDVAGALRAVLAHNSQRDW